MLSVESTGKTIEKAIENALLELKAPREDVDIKILSEGGLFKKAKVLVSISEDAKEKYEKRKSFRQEEKEEILAEKAKIKKESEEIEKDTTEIKQESQEILKESEEIKQESKEIKKETNKEKYSKSKEEKVLDPIEFLTGYFKALGKEVQISVEEDEKFKTFSVIGDDLGEAIGHRGEAYYALTNIFQAVTGRQEKRFLLDIDNYRVKREESLTATAKRIASKVAKSGRYYKLEPMKPAERRIIHTALQDDDRVTTLSKGTEPHRYVIVFPKEYKDR